MEAKGPRELSFNMVISVSPWRWRPGTQVSCHGYICVAMVMEAKSLHELSLYGYICVTIVMEAKGPRELSLWLYMCRHCNGGQGATRVVL